MAQYYESIKFDKNMLGWVYRFSDYQYEFYDIHWHRDIEITYILSGLCKVAVNGKTSILEPGDLLIVNAGDTHYFNLNNEGDICNALVLIVPYPLLKKTRSDIDRIRFFASPSDAHYPKLISLLQKLNELLDEAKTDEYIYLKINSIIYEIIYMLFQYYSSPVNLVSAFEHGSSRGIEICKEILEYIDENFREDITLESSAKHCNMSKEYISRTMKSNLGMTFKQYLTDIRLNNACIDLLETQASILQISIDNGFPNCKSFITTFSRKYSLTPQVYRNSYRSTLDKDRFLL